MTRQASNIIAGGQFLVAEMVRAEHRMIRPRLLAEAHAKYAAAMACAGRFDRAMFRLRIRREVDEILRVELDRLASPYSQY